MIKNDVLTALIHLSYLAYDRRNESAYIPNEEIRSEFIYATKKIEWNGLYQILENTEELLHEAA